MRHDTTTQDAYTRVTGTRPVPPTSAQNARARSAHCCGNRSCALYDATADDTLAHPNPGPPSAYQAGGHTSSDPRTARAQARPTRASAGVSEAAGRGCGRCRRFRGRISARTRWNLAIRRRVRPCSCRVGAQRLLTRAGSRGRGRGSVVCSSGRRLTRPEAEQGDRPEEVGPGDDCPRARRYRRRNGPRVHIRPVVPAQASATAFEVTDKVAHQCAPKPAKADPPDSLPVCEDVPAAFPRKGRTSA